MKVPQTKSELRVDLGFYWEGFCWDTAWTKGTVTHLACQPGQEMPGWLGDRIVADLRRVMPDYGVAQYFGSQPGIFKSYDHLAITINRQTGGVVGLIGSKWLKFHDERPFLYIWTAMIGNEYRGSDLFPTLVQLHFASIRAIEGRLPEVIATKTYNPAVYGLIKKIFLRADGVTLYPELESAAVSAPHLRQLACDVASVVAPTLPFDPETSVVKGGQAVLAPDYFPYMQKTSRAAVWDHFQKHVAREDQILCAIHIPPQSADALVRNAGWDALLQ